MSKVYFWNLRASHKYPYEIKIKRLVKETGFLKFISRGDLVALKIHFGEKGTTSFISPIYLQPIVDLLKKTGAKPFLTDTNTLYIGERGEAVSHLMLSAKHGFLPSITGAPVIIGDGLKSTHEQIVEAKGNHFTQFYLAKDILESDALINIAHFKGHELTGFGGAIKNIGMGCATRQGKMQQHCGLGPRIKRDRCVGCGRCIQYCKVEALFLDKENKIMVDHEKCVGCAMCLLVCRNKALEVNWKVDVKIFLERLAEYCNAFVAAYNKPILHINFIIHVSPTCDCVGYSDAPLCPDIGVLASFDPVALDKASLDLVNNAPVVNYGQYKQNPYPGQDKFKAVHGHTQGEHCLEYAQALGLGEMKYQLITL